jgi:hypothetical protein
MDKHASYIIKVNGILDEKWGNRVCGMKVKNIMKKPGKSITILEGSVKDQAELLGILNTLYELHLSVVRVEKLGSHREG